MSPIVRISVFEAFSNRSLVAFSFFVLLRVRGGFKAETWQRGS